MTSGSFQIEARLPGMRSSFQGETGLLLKCDRNVGIPFPTKPGNRPSSPFGEGENVDLLELWCETQCSSRVGTGISVDFLSCIKGVKYTFAFQEVTWYSSIDTALEKGLISR